MLKYYNSYILCVYRGNNMKKNVKVPKFYEMMKPLLRAMKLLGGSGTIEEIDNKTIEFMGLSDEILAILHTENGNQSEVEYRLAWTRTYLKKYGLLENSSRAVWALTNDLQNIEQLSEKEIVRAVREQNDEKMPEGKDALSDENLENDGIERPDEIKGWRDKLRLFAESCG